MPSSETTRQNSWQVAVSDANVCVVCGWSACRCETWQDVVCAAMCCRTSSRNIVHLRVIGDGERTACGILVSSRSWIAKDVCKSSELAMRFPVTCVRCMAAAKARRILMAPYPSISSHPEAAKEQAIVTAYSGAEMDLSNPKPYSVRMGDIARALSGIRRFNGHLYRRVSVAHHSLAVARIVRSRSRSSDVVLCALMHDAHEAYIGDISTPVKRQLGPEYKALESKVQLAILRATCPESVSERGWERQLPDLVKEADRMALHYEASKWLNAKWPVAPQISVHAKAAYLLSDDDAAATFVETALELGAREVGSESER